MNENDKDWGNPIVRTIYLALATANGLRVGNEVVDWLNANGFANMTCCPMCHVDDFVHVEGCKLAKAVEASVLFQAQ
jgi:hypothetical protein